MGYAWLTELKELPTPESAYRTRRYWVTLLVQPPLVALGCFFLGAAVHVVLVPGDGQAGPLVGYGTCFVLIGVSIFFGVIKPRRRTWDDPPPATFDGEGLVLPRRRTVLVCCLGLFTGASGLGLALLIGSSGLDRWIGVGMLVLFPGLAALAVRQPPLIRLSPRGLGLTTWDPVRGDLDWEEIGRVEVLGGIHPHLVVTVRGSGERITFNLHAQAWAPSAILAAITHFDRRKTTRAQLTDPAALERFRTWRRR